MWEDSPRTYGENTQTQQTFTKSFFAFCPAFDPLIVVSEHQWFISPPDNFLTSLLCVLFINQDSNYCHQTSLISHQFFCLFCDYSKGISNSSNTKHQNANHVNLTWQGRRKSNTLRVSGDLKGGVTWEHINMCHLATQLSQRDAWRMTLYITGDFIYMLYIYVIQLLWLLCNEGLPHWFEIRFIGMLCPPLQLSSCQLAHGAFPTPSLLPERSLDE